MKISKLPHIVVEYYKELLEELKEENFALNEIVQILIDEKGII